MSANCPSIYLSTLSLINIQLCFEMIKDWSEEMCDKDPFDQLLTDKIADRVESDQL